MTRTFAALAVAALVSLAPAIAPSPAQAHDRGGAIAAGVIGGLAAGAIIGSAVARPAPPPVYYAPPPAPVVQEECWYERSRVWDPYAGVWRRGPRRMVCE